MLELDEDMLKPTEGSHDFGKPLLRVDDKESEKFFVISLRNPPNPENHLYLRPQPLDSSPHGDSLIAYHKYSKAAGYPFPAHRFAI